MEHFSTDFLNLSSFTSLIFLVCIGASLYIIKALRDKHFSFNVQMLAALAIGVIWGLILQNTIGFSNVDLDTLKASSEGRWYYEVHVWLDFFTSAFISILKLLIIPLIFVGIVTVILRLQKEISIGSILSRSLGWLVITTAIASLIGIALGVATHLGLDTQGEAPTKSLKDIKAFSDVLLGLIPSNIVTAMSSNNIVGVVIFAFLVAFGARAVNAKHEKGGEIFYNFFHFSYEIIMLITKKVINAMPFMILLMITDTILSNGFGTLLSALHFIILAFVAAFLVFVVHGLILLFHGLSPTLYFKKAFTPLLMAFSSRSSSGTLPVTISTLTDKLGVSQGSASLVATLGTTMGMNGCAGYFAALVCVFMLNTLNIAIGFNEVLIIVLLSVISSIGIAGIPGITIMIITVILTGLGLESHFALLGVILAVDPVVDMARTTSNVSGAMIASIATDKELGLLNESVYKQESTTQTA